MLGFRSFASILLTFAISLLVIAPLFVVLKTSLTCSDFSIPPFSSISSWTSDNLLTIKLSLQNYITILKNSYYAKTFLNSMEIGWISTLLCLVFGFAMAYGIYNARDSTKNILILLVSLSFWTSFLIRIYAWMNLLSMHGMVNSFLMKIGIIDSPIRFIGNYYAISLGLVFCYLPFMILPIYTVLHRLDRSCIDAAYDLGASPLGTFWRIIVPLARQGITNGCLLVFAASIGEFVIPELLGGADINMFGRVIWNEFFTNLNWPMACALSVVMMIFMIFPMIIFQNKSEKKQ
jgi:putrescine transport system permease protein